MGSKPAGSKTRFGDVLNSGKSIVMSKVHKAPSPAAALDSEEQRQFD